MRSCAPFAARDVAVPAQQARVRERARRLRLDLLDADAEQPHARRAALLARGGQARLAVALVADEAVVLLVVRQGDGAAAALRHEAAVAALDVAARPRRLRKRITCSSAASAVSIAPRQRAAEHAAVAGCAAPRADRRRRSAAWRATPSGRTLPSAAGDGPDALGQREQRVLAARRALVRDDVRRRAAEHHDGALQPRQLDRGVARVVARLRVLLLVRPLVLFVDDDQAEVRLRREDGRARADDDVVAPVGDAVPLVEQLAVAEAAVQHGDALEALAEAPHRLRRQRDLRHQHDRAPARSPRSGRARAGRPRSCRCR